MTSDPTTYSGLQASLIAWMDDATLTSRVPEFIALTERRLSRKLNTPEMETTATLTLTKGAATLPSDFMEMRAGYIDYENYRTPLTELSQADFNERYASDSLGRPVYYAISGGSMIVRPMPDLDYAVVITYKAMIPALSTTRTTNWLLTKWCDLYLAACIVTASAYTIEDNRLPLVASNADALLDEVNEAGRKQRYSGGPLVMRAPVGDNRGNRIYR